MLNSFAYSLLVGFVAVSFSWASFAGEDLDLANKDRVAELERKVEYLIEELERVRIQGSVPETKELKSRYGFGPAASKVHGIDRGISIGGYGEASYTNYVSDDDSGTTQDGSGNLVSDRLLDRSDFYRLVTYLGYRFNERLIFNSEIEFEHAKAGSNSVSAGSGSVSVEMAHLDFLFNDWINVRAGMLLLPVGFINEIHEPSTFHGVNRPEVERRLIPTTWRENGVGIFGNLGETIEYRTYLATGFNATGFSDAGIRGGRQNGNRTFAENLSVVARLDWTPVPEWLLGGSIYTGSSGQNQEIAGVSLPDARLTMWDVHTQYRARGLEARMLFTMSDLSSAGALNRALGRDADRPIAERMYGGYAEIAYDFWPKIVGHSGRYLAPFFRFEYLDPQGKIPSGYTANRNRTRNIYTMGISFKPIPDVVLKAEYRNIRPRDSDAASELSFGMGFAF